MDSNKSNRIGGRFNDQSGPVPFQGIGTRLRRSLSKDHSNELDNLSTATLEVENLRASSRNNAFDQHGGLGYLKGGTLERPKRLYGFSNVTNNGPFINQQSSLYDTRGTKNVPLSLYDESRLLAHQYEEPQLLLYKDSIYDTNPNRRKSKDSFNRKRQQSSRTSHTQIDTTELNKQFHAYSTVDTNLPPPRMNTTVIPPSKLFAKGFATSYNTTNTTITNNNNNNNNVSDEFQSSKGHPYSSRQMVSHSIRSTNGFESDSPTKNEHGLLLCRTSTSKMSSSSSSSVGDHRPIGMGETANSENEHNTNTTTERTFNELNSTLEIDHQDLPPKQCLTSSSQSSVMHTYANPFQSGCGGSSFSEDTTGPIIPDISTLRPSQLLKSSYTCNGPPPSLHASSAKGNVISCFLNRLWSRVGRIDQKTELGEHRCSWRVSTITLIVLVFILLLIIILLSAMSPIVINAQSKTETPKVPCIVVEDLDSTSSSHLFASSSSSSSSTSVNRGEYISPQVAPENSFNCPLSLPRDPLQFKEIHLVDGLTPFSFRLAPYTTWTVWFTQMETARLNFQFYAPLHARLVLLANRNEPPSFGLHQVFQVINDEILSSSSGAIQRRTIRESQLMQMQTRHELEHGSWYITILNDLDHSVSVVLNISVIHNESVSCTNNCNNNGHCHLGKCQCFPGFIGHDCADNVCPVFCNGHGQYLQGSCRCEANWKGRECTIRTTECEVPDCNGNGACIDGMCHCRTGFKGEHCEQVDCIDPKCSDHGVCFEGNCICKTGWAGDNCSLIDSRLHQFFPNCSNNGIFDLESSVCLCHSHYSGLDCAKPNCNLECGKNGFCQEGKCKCMDGWFGERCEQLKCDARCLEHGKCLNGSCLCNDGWMGKYCTLDGCPNLCFKHGRCISTNSIHSNVSYELPVGTNLQWYCQCDDGWGGNDCSAPQENNCNDEIDNDNDGLIDCADSECCRHEQCGHQSLMCITSPDPLDILLRKRPLSPISSFFQKVHFLIEDGSVQSYAQKDAYSERRVSVIRGHVVSKEFNGLIGVRVSVATDPQFGFTLTRSDGWFDILVNGGGIVTLQFQRNPFYPIKKSVYIAWNDIAVIQSPIVMYSVPETGNDFLGLFNSRSSLSFSSFTYRQFSLLSFDLNQLNWSTRKSNSTHGEINCVKHHPEQVKPTIRNMVSKENSWLTKNTGVVCGGDKSCIIAETQSVHEKISIGSSRINLVYQSFLSEGYQSTLYIELTSSRIPNGLRFILVRILIEGNVHERIFEAESNLVHKFSWNKRNIYKQKVYGFANAKVYVGYIYNGCVRPIWKAFHAKIRGFDMEISDLGGWNLDIHHRYNQYDSLFQRGDGQIVYFEESSSTLPLSIEPFAGAHLQSRPFSCSNGGGGGQCGTNLSDMRFFSLVALANAPDGSVFVGDANLIWRITPDGRIQLIHQFKLHSSNRQNYEYYIAFNSIDHYLYISDPEKLQIVRIQITDKSDSQYDSPLSDVEVVIGNGQRCLPHDGNHCGDGRLGPDAQLIFPKGLAFALDGTLFFADGNLIRVLDTTGHVHRIVGHWNRKQWKPTTCKTSQLANEFKAHWPTSLSINPVDGELYFVDNYVVYKLSHQMRVSIVAGLPSYCLEETLNNQLNWTYLNCDSNRLDSKMFSYCGESLLFGGITFASSGTLYLSDISRQGENRIYSYHSDDGSLTHVAGIKLVHNDNAINCSVERCSDIGGHNCTCLIADEVKTMPEFNSIVTERTLGVKAKLYSISALTTTGDGTVYVADEGSLRLLRLRSYSPQVDEHLEIKILAPNLGEMYTFNEHGQHINTRSTITGRTLFSFHYNQDNNFGKLTDVVDMAGNKLSFIRDSTGSLHTIECSSGFKTHTLVNKFGLLEQIGIDSNRSLMFEYNTNGLIRSKIDMSTGQTYFYVYDSDGRIMSYIMPSGTVVQLAQKYEQSEKKLIAYQTSLFENDFGQTYLNNNHLMLTFNNWSQMKIEQPDRTFEIRSISDGTIQVNTLTHNMSAHFYGKTSHLSRSMLPIQAQMFSHISGCRVEYNFGREQGNLQTFNLNVELDLKLKSSMISSVEKLVSINNSSMIKLEYDWKANREIYYNQTQRPLLYVQYDENGRPVQWVPNNNGRLLPQTFSYDKSGHLSGWQDGQTTYGYLRNNAAQLIEVHQLDRVIRYSYGHGIDHSQSNLPIDVILASGNKYHFEHDSNGRLQAIVTPKNGKHDLNIEIILGYYRFTYCPPSPPSSSSSAYINQPEQQQQQPQRSAILHCHQIYFDERQRTMMKALPYNHGKIIYNYGVRTSLSRDNMKELQRSVDDANQLVDQIIFGSGFIERWYDRKSGNDGRGIWRCGNHEFSIVYKYNRNNGLLKHQSYQVGNVHSQSQLTYNYRYDNAARLRTIHAKLGSINLPSQEFSYNPMGQIETINNFRYFERNRNETLLGDGVSLFVRRYDSTRRQIRHSSVTIADKEVIRIDYLYDSFNMLIQTRTAMRHLGASKMRLQNYTYDLDGQLVEVEGRENWRFVYDPNGNLITFLYLGNRVDIGYDSADRVRNFGKSQDDTSRGTSTSPYATDMRGFVVQRGDERLTYNQLGQLLSAIQEKRYEIHYGYDYRHRLVMRRDHQNNVTQYFYGNPLKPNLITHAFNNAEGKVLSLIYDDSDDSLIMLRVNNENFYVACDQTNSPLLVLDHRGQVVKEIHRSPYGHVLFDSNPSFYIPVDFHGGIPDPITNLILFGGNRIYDTLIGRWLTPQVESLLENNLFTNPSLVHLYQFSLNNPVKMVPISPISPIESRQYLMEQTESLIEQETNINQQLHLLANFKPSPVEFPVHSHLLASLQFITDELQHFSRFKSNNPSKIAQQDWPSVKSFWNQIAMKNGLFGNSGIILTRNGSTIQVYAQHPRTDSLWLQLCNLILNGSNMLDVHLLIEGNDHYFIVREHQLDGKSMAQLNRLQQKLNFTVHTYSGGESDNHRPMIDVRISLHTIVLNIRIGVPLVKERERIIRMAKKYAIEQRLSQERMNIEQNNPSQQWTDDEKQFILSSHDQSWQKLNSMMPFKVEQYHTSSTCRQLTDDATNILFKSKKHH